MQRCLFEGVCVAIVTPFKDGKVDYSAMENLIEYQIKNNVKAISVLGTTGEPCTLTTEEKENIIVFCNKVINKRVKYIVGSGANNTLEAVKLSKFASENGADGLLVVTPYYNKCTQQGLVEYYNTIAEASKLPIIVYNVPSRTGVNILPDTLVQIAENQYIYGFKQASSNMQENLEIFRKLKDKISIYSGEDDLNYVFYTLGGKGAVSVTANAYPRTVQLIYDEVQNNNFAYACQIQEKLAGINKAMFSEVNPIPVKRCLSLLGLIENEVRAPLTIMSNDTNLKLEMDKLKKENIEC